MKVDDGTELSNIFWRKNELRIVQGKTGHPLMLPLKSSVRDALADYILNERSQSSSKNVFLRTCAPYAPFCDSMSIASIFRRYLEKVSIQHQFNDGKTFHVLLLGDDIDSCKKAAEREIEFFSKKALEAILTVPDVSSKREGEI